MPGTRRPSLQSAPTERVVILDNIFERLPIFTKGRAAEKIQATDVYLFTTAALKSDKLVLTQAANDQDFQDGVTVGAMKSFVINGMDNLPMTSWQLKIKDLTTKVDNLWLVVRYVLK